MVIGSPSAAFGRMIGASRSKMMCQLDQLCRVLSCLCCRVYRMPDHAMPEERRSEHLCLRSPRAWIDRRAILSGSSVRVANAFSIVPSTHATDGKTHILPANHVWATHRWFDQQRVIPALRVLFRDNRFAIHDPLPCAAHYADEGQANVMLMDNGKVIFWHTINNLNGNENWCSHEQPLSANHAKSRIMSVKHPVHLLHHEFGSHDAFHADLSFTTDGRTLYGRRKLHSIPSRIVRGHDPTDYNALIVGDTVVCTQRSAAMWRKTHANVIPVDLSESLRGFGGPSCLCIHAKLTDKDVAGMNGSFLN